MWRGSAFQTTNSRCGSGPRASTSRTSRSTRTASSSSRSTPMARPSAGAVLRHAVRGVPRDCKLQCTASCAQHALSLQGHTSKRSTQRSQASKGPRVLGVWRFVVCMLCVCARPDHVRCVQRRRGPDSLLLEDVRQAAGEAQFDGGVAVKRPERVSLGYSMRTFVATLRELTTVTLAGECTNKAAVTRGPRHLSWRSFAFGRSAGVSRGSRLVCAVHGIAQASAALARGQACVSWVRQTSRPARRHTNAAMLTCAAPRAA